MRQGVGACFASLVSPKGPFFNFLHHRGIAEATARPANFSATPLPVKASKVVASSALRLTASAPLRRFGQRMFRPSVPVAAAKDSKSASGNIPQAQRVVSFGLPIVSVPVLSTISVSTPAHALQALCILDQYGPLRASSGQAVVMEIGVASPSAQGHGDNQPQRRLMRSQKTSAGSGQISSHANESKDRDTYDCPATKRRETRPPVLNWARDRRGVRYMVTICGQQGISADLSRLDHEVPFC